MINVAFEIRVTAVDLESIWPVLKEQGRECANELMQMENAIVGNWKMKPAFTIAEKESNDVAEFTVTPVGANVNRWRAVSRGAHGKMIVPKNVPMLRFPYAGKGVSYMPKTMRGFYGGPGSKVGPIRQFSAVNWPGIEGRHFEEDVMEAYRPTFNAKMNSAVARARIRGR
jgi:hypothetical protein